MTSKNIYIDMDGVICDSIDRWIDWCKERWSLEELHCNYWSHIQDQCGQEACEFWQLGSNVYDISEPFPGAIGFVQSLMVLDYNIKFVTATFPNMEYAKIDWFKKHMPFVNENQIICVDRDKYHLTKNGILIDDGFHNIVEHVSHNNGLGILYNHDRKYAHADMFSNCCDQWKCKFSKMLYAHSYSGILHLLK